MRITWVFLLIGDGTTTTVAMATTRTRTRTISPSPSPPPTNKSTKRHNIHGVYSRISIIWVSMRFRLLCLVWLKTEWQTGDVGSSFGFYALQRHYNISFSLSLSLSFSLSPQAWSLFSPSHSFANMANTNYDFSPSGKLTVNN